MKFKFPELTHYVKLIGAPGTGHKYELECFTTDGDTLGTVITDLALVDQACKSKKLRVNGDTQWAVVGFDNLLPVGLPKFLR